MSFSFDTPTTTHPQPNATVETKEEVTHGADDQGKPADAGTTADNVADVDKGTGGEGSNGDNGGEVPQEVDGGAEGQPAEVDWEGATFFYGGQQVTIEIPEDVEAGLKEAGLDAKAIAIELYKEGGDFTLSKETREKLDKAFGKFAVDAYLNGLKAQNDATLARFANEAKEREQADVQRFTDISTAIGGEEGWNRLEEFALATLSDDELEGFNQVMASGNRYLQEYAVRELESKRKAAQGDDKVDLIQPDNAAGADKENGPLSAQEYIKAIAQLGSTYGRDRKAAAEAQAKLDARRRAGIAQGL